MNRRTFLGNALVTLGVTGLAGQGVVPAVGDPVKEPPVNPPLLDLINLDDVERVARSVMRPDVYAYISGGAGDEITLRRNRERYQDILIQPKAVVDLSRLDCGVSLFGQKMPFPIILAPTASQKLSHLDGELATVAGAGAMGATMVLSSGSNTAIEEVIGAASAPVWFQLYTPKDRGFAKALVERVELAGARALCITVDNPVNGSRNREQHAKLKIPPNVIYPHYLGMGESRSSVTLDEVRPAQLLWKDVEWLRSLVKIPVLLKGITNPDDAEIAVRMGISGIVVSNHGGRELDTQPATIEVLPQIVRRVNGRVPVIVDGGIRRGTDIVKAIALGASAIQIGRPYVYGLAVAGAPGVAHVLKILRQELLIAMALLGRPTIASIDRSVLWEK